MKFPAKPIWTDSHGLGRNRYVLFRKNLNLDFEPEKATLHLFADTRYRLLLNGQVVCHGPARFRQNQPEYDTVDLVPWLQPGRNTLAVIVNSYGTVSFHSDVAPGCLVTWGEVLGEDGQQVSLSCDEGFKAIDDPSHAIQTPRMSFALNPAEHFDARKLPAGWSLPDFDDSDWPEAVALEDVSAWSALSPRSIPMLDERYVTPASRLGAWVAKPLRGERIYRLAVVTDSPGGRRRQSTVGLRAFLHSPRAQSVTLGAWWGKYFLNGVELEPCKVAREHRRQEYTLQLQEGFNELQVWENFPGDYWAIQLSLPDDADLKLLSQEDPQTQGQICYARPVEGSMEELGLDLPLEDPTDVAGPWMQTRADQLVGDACSQRAWRRLEPIQSDPWLEEDVPELAAKAGDEADSVAIAWDFGTEVLGRCELEFEAAEGTSVDLSYSERLTDGGDCDIHYRYHVDMTERCIAGQGRQTWQTFHPRGFRYLELRVTGDLKQFRLHRLGLTRANYPAERVGSFECSQGTLNDIWRIGSDALHACMEDAYLDCPHRERGLYSGDFLVEFLAGTAVVDDTRLFARCIELFLLGQGDNGLVPGGAQGLRPGHLPDYSAILVSALWWHWAYTGDLGLVRKHRDRLVKLLEGLDALARGGGIIDDPDARPYIDLARMGEKAGSCALNCFCYGAFRDGGDLLAKLGDDQAPRWAKRGEQLKDQIHEAFWDAQSGLYLDAAGPEGPPSVHANALAVYFEIAPQEAVEGIVAWLLEQLESNFVVYPPTDNVHCNVTSYFAYYPLEVLLRHGKGSEAIECIGRLWGWMLQNGAWTTWEYFADKSGASLCHAWSASPNYFLSREILGVRRIPGEPDAVEVDPRPGDLEWAQGTVPHPLGTIEVRWKMVAGEIDLQVEAPDDLEIRFSEIGEE
jgi:hypothetical protein